MKKSIRASLVMTQALVLVFGLAFSHTALAFPYATYYFNGAGDLLLDFKPDVDADFTEATSGGLGNSRAVSVDTRAGLYAATTTTYAQPEIGETLTVSGYFYNDGNSGYGGLGFMTASTTAQGQAFPTTSGVSAQGISFHGGGGDFVLKTDNSASLDDRSWVGGDLVDGQWYKMVYSITKTGDNTFGTVFQVWESDSSGSLSNLKTQHYQTEITNSDFGSAPVWYAYFAADGGDRFVYVDSFEVANDVLDEPVEVGTCQEIIDINDALFGSYLLTADLDCTADGNGIMIAASGTSDGAFRGIFDGDGHTITIDLDVVDQIRTGLFRVVQEGTVKDLTVEGTINVSEDAEEIGGLAGVVNNSVVSNVTTGVTIVALHGSGNVISEVGGVAGYAFETTFESVSSSGSITSEDYVGGVIGNADYSYFNESSATGDVVGANQVGGFVGHSQSTEIFDSFATGDVTAISEVGGFVGLNESDSDIRRTYATGDVDADEYVGGFAGRNAIDSYISKAYATGGIAGTSNIGGFVGTNSANILYSYSSGDVTGDMAGDNAVGGFAGFSSGSIRSSFSASAVTTDASNGGGFIGEAEDGSEYRNAGWWTGSGLVNAIGYDGGLGTFAATIDHNEADRTAFYDDTHDLYENFSVEEWNEWDFDDDWTTLADTAFPVFLWQGIEEPQPEVVVEEQAAEGSRSGNGGSKKKIFKKVAKVDDLVMPEAVETVSEVASVGPARDLEVTMEGEDVKSLQLLLIAQNKGPAAQALASVGATGYFGNYTREALAEYQQSVGIVPSAGYFGPLTRAQMKAAGFEGLWW